MIECGACNKLYSSKHCLKKHHQRQPLCAEWLKLKPSLKSYVNNKLMLPHDAGFHENKCGICGTMFSNKGNLNRHLDNSLVCRKWLVYEDAQQLQAYINTIPTAYPDPEQTEDSTFATFEAPAYSLCHIIWNVFVIDKELAKKQDMSQIVKDNNIGYVLAILPDEKEYPSDLAFVPHEVMAYEGHTPTLNVADFDKQCALIEEHRKNRVNVFVFCNNGYQRTIPFLTYYLTRFHGDEVPTIERAMDLILPQVDKANYASIRDGYVRDITELFKDL